MSASDPLWRVMEAGFLAGRNPGYCDRLGYAAEIRAVAKWVESRTAAEPGLFSPEEMPVVWRIAGLLLVEADRAEAEG